jgi:hypothetical protein
MGRKRNPAPDPLIHDPVTLRVLADEADKYRHRTAFGLAR